MCGGENTARPASVPKGRAQKAACPSVGKGFAFFDKLKARYDQRHTLLFFMGEAGPTRLFSLEICFFEGITKLLYIFQRVLYHIDDKIKYIESKALYTHKKNITLYISAVEPPVIQSDTFYGFNAIHVPSGSLDLYKSANNWSAYGDFMIGDL